MARCGCGRLDSLSSYVLHQFADDQIALVGVFDFWQTPTEYIESRRNVGQWRYSHWLLSEHHHRQAWHWGGWWGWPWKCQKFQRRNMDSSPCIFGESLYLAKWIYHSTRGSSSTQIVGIPHTRLGCARFFSLVPRHSFCGFPNSPKIQWSNDKEEMTQHRQGLTHMMFMCCFFRSGASSSRFALLSGVALFKHVQTINLGHRLHAHRFSVTIPHD